MLVLNKKTIKLIFEKKKETHKYEYSYKLKNSKNNLTIKKLKYLFTLVPM